MDPEPITAALAAGAAAGASGVATLAIKDLYAALRSAVRTLFPTVKVESLEEDPTSRAKQAALAADLVAAGADRDAQLLGLAKALVAAIEREAPQAAASAGVDLEGIKAEFVKLERVEGHVGVRNVETSGGVTITDVRQARGPDPNR